jgi:hypothetical protein
MLRRSWLTAVLLSSVIVIHIAANAQVCGIITASSNCASKAVVITGVNDGAVASCTQTALYGSTSPLGPVIGTMFLTVVASQKCPAGSGVVSVTLTASTNISPSDTAILGTRASFVNDTGLVLFQTHGAEDCALGFSETIDVDNPAACLPPSGGGGGGGDCEEDLGDGSGYAPEQNCGDTSPIIIDVSGRGFFLTSATNGVKFDIRGKGNPVQIGWTALGADNAFLALPGADGLVHNGKELFGNFTPQPQSLHPNGFLALGVYDKPENGGNGDGIIDEHDSVFSKLRLWIDVNHDGICQPEELHRLAELGVYSLSFNYVESRRTDQFGNQFRYKARVNPGERRDARDQTPSGDAGRWTYDVFLATH